MGRRTALPTVLLLAIGALLMGARLTTGVPVTFSVLVGYFNWNSDCDLWFFGMEQFVDDRMQMASMQTATLCPVVVAQIHSGLCSFRCDIYVRLCVRPYTGSNPSLGECLGGERVISGPDHDNSASMQSALTFYTDDYKVSQSDAYSEADSNADGDIE